MNFVFLAQFTDSSERRGFDGNGEIRNTRCRQGTAH